MAAVVLALSLLLQVAAAVFAWRLVRLTERNRAWMFVAAALGLMAFRRSITLVRIVAGDIAHPPDLAAELVSLFVSVLMLVGLAWVAPLFLSMRRAEREVRQLIEAAPDAMVIADASRILPPGSDSKIWYASPIRCRFQSFQSNMLQSGVGTIATITVEAKAQIANAHNGATAP